MVAMVSTCAAYELDLPTLSPLTLTEVGRPLNVLLVEDDPEAAELVRISLSGRMADADKEDAFHIEWHPNLLEAMNRLAGPVFDVILLDLGLPELSGYKSYRAIEFAAGNRIPIVILTADDRPASRELSLQLGAADYLVKATSSPARLRQALRNAVIRRRIEDLGGE